MSRRGVGAGDRIDKWRTMTLGKCSNTLRGLTEIPMMQPTNHRFRVDWPEIRQLNGSRPRAILFQSKVSSRPVVVSQVVPQNPPQMPLTEDDHMIETLSAN